MTNTINTTLAFINALRNREIFFVKSYDAYEENNELQVNFKDHEGTWVLTNPITKDEATELMSNLPTHRRRMMVRAFGI
nr:MAG TPA: hypothetical protein [Caudoviricetes sp.]